jgi:glycerophosphoryl diester phosphodiesterase
LRKNTLAHLGRIIGHRGVAALAPENTLESFALAYHYGLTSVEFDVTLSADGEAFVIHDATLERTTNGRGEIALVSAEYLKTLDAGSWFAKQYAATPIPTLRETVLWLRQHKMSANIEIKPAPGCMYATVNKVLDLLDDLWPKTLPLPLISSFDADVLRLCRALQPNLPIGYLLHKWDPEEINFAESLACVSVNLNHWIASAKRIQALKKRGFAVYVYTVNYQFLISRYVAMGVDGLFSDYPTWRL